MVRGLNRVFLMGNLTRDPELRYTPAGQAVTNFSIAINRNYIIFSNIMCYRLVRCFNFILIHSLLPLSIIPKIGLV